MTFEAYLEKVKNFKDCDFKLEKEFNDFNEDQKAQLFETVRMNEDITSLDCNEIDLNSEKNLHAIICFLKQDETIASINFSKNTGLQILLERLFQLLRKRDNIRLTNILASARTKQNTIYDKIKKHLEYNAVYQNIKNSREWGNWHKNTGIIRRKTRLDIAAMYFSLSQVDPDLNVLEDMTLLIGAIPENTILKKLIFPGSPLLKSKEIKQLNLMFKEHTSEFKKCIPELSFENRPKVKPAQNPTTLPRKMLQSFKKPKKNRKKSGQEGGIRKMSVSSIIESFSPISRRPKTKPKIRS